MAQSAGIGTQSSPSGSSFWERNRRTVLMVLGALVAVAAFYYVLPRLVGLGPTLKRLSTGDVWWLALGVLLEAASLVGEIALFRGVFSTRERPISWSTSSEIIFAGAAATKLVSAAGAGGIAMTVWALRSLGFASAEVADGMVCYEIVTYSVYAASVLIAGLGLWFGLFSGPAPVGLTLIPALIAAGVIVVVAAMLFVDEPAERLLLRLADRANGRLSRWLRAAAAFPRALHAGLLQALDMVKRRDPALLGAVAYWGFDIATLWASFHAFGHSPPGAVLVMGYFLGTLGNALPLPGGVGGVEGGMIAAFLGFGVSSDLAVLAVLGYRTISYWLPTIPGAIAYFRLRHRFADTAPASSSGEP